MMKYVFCTVIILSLAVSVTVFFVDSRDTTDDIVWLNPPPATVVVVQTSAQDAPGWPAAIPNPLENRPALPDTPNLALGRPVEASTQVRGLAGSHVTDGSPHTLWESARLPAFITIDLEAIHTIQTIAVALNPQWDMHSQVFEVLTSKDGETFDIVAESDVHLFTPRTANTIRIDFAPVDAQYVRLIFTANTAVGIPGAQVAEIMIFQ